MNEDGTATDQSPSVTWMVLPHMTTNPENALQTSYIYPVYHFHVYREDLMMDKRRTPAVICMNYRKSNPTTMPVAAPVPAPFHSPSPVSAQPIPHARKDAFKTFWVNPDVQTEIYHLYDISPMKKYVGIAHIPDCQTSHLLNVVCRNMKEYHTNLDVLEESDDDCEVVSSRPDDGRGMKEVRMKCKYNGNFGKWTPISVVQG